MAYLRSLDKSFDGARDMEVLQSKKRTSSHACLIIVDKTKNKTTVQRKTFSLWLGFKILNVLNASKELSKETHKNVRELVKLGMYE